jgi:hypothetical protein
VVFKRLVARQLGQLGVAYRPTHCAVLISFLTIYATTWANRQIGEYRARFEMRSDLSKITTGQFLET